jgi:hypothetical protein
MIASCDEPVPHLRLVWYQGVIHETESDHLCLHVSQARLLSFLLDWPVSLAVNLFFSLPKRKLISVPMELIHHDDIEARLL